MCFVWLVGSISMDSGLVMSSRTACSLTPGGNLRHSKHPNNNIYHAGFFTSKASHHRRKTQIEYNILKFQEPSLNHYYKWIEGGSTNQECNKKYAVKATPKSSFDDSETRVDFLKNFFDIFYKFCYPYAIIAIILSAISSSFLAVEKLSDISLPFFIGVVQAVIPHLFVEIYVSAVNQVFDFQIDKINKPYLPLASGQLSLTTVIIIAASFLTLSLGLCWIIGSWPLFWNIVLAASIWSIYSFNVPLLRWKRHPVLAAICTVSVFSYALPITFFLHMQTFVLKRSIVFPRSLIAFVSFMSVYSTGMALSKDIPDIEGDKAYGVDTFAVRLGQKRVFWICVYLYEMAFGVAFLAGVTSPYLWIKIVTGLGNVVLASILWYQAKSTDLNDKSSGGSFYMLIWKLLYASYVLMAIIR